LLKKQVCSDRDQLSTWIIVQFVGLTFHNTGIYKFTHIFKKNKTRQLPHLASC